MKKEFFVSDLAAPVTVREYVRGVCGISARTLKNAKYNGDILVNGLSVHTDYHVNNGDTLVLETPDIASASIEPQDLPFDILAETADYLIVNKPSGMASHPTLTYKDGTLANAVMYYYRAIPFTFRLLTRLDVDTSGAAVIAKNAYFAGAFAQRCPQKTYYAICVGTPEPLSGRIELPIGRDPESLIKRRIDFDGKPSQTLYRTLSVKQKLSLVEVQPLTGRTHQIRLHMASIGCPLYGDFLYGTEINGERTRLHCQKICFSDALNRNVIQVEAPLPMDFQKLI